MARRLHGLLLAPALLAGGALHAATAGLPAVEPMDQFVTRDGDRLVVGTEEYRFVSVNMPDVLQVITNYRFTNHAVADRFRIPDEFEQRDAIRTVRQMGGRVLRTFVITCGTPDNAAAMFHVTADGVTPHEPALVALDRLLHLAREDGVRLMIPLIAYRSPLRGDPSTYGPDFWTVGSAANGKFKAMLTQLLGRTNTLNRIPYRDDPTIFGWQTGNELVIGDDPERRAWLHDIAATIKRLAPKHLLIDGRNKPNDVYNLYDEFSADPNIDAVSYHTYVNLPEADTPAGTLRLIREQLRGRTPVIVSEVAMYTSPAALRTLLDEIIAGGTVGANWWGLRFHNRDGGFYKHSDRDSQFEDLNWPGFHDSRVNLPELARERELLGILHDYAGRIRGLPPVPTVVPEPPVFLPASDPGHLTWRGSTGASAYDVQRAPAAAGPWHTIAAGLGDHLVVYAPQFCDSTADIGVDHFYRVLARNEVGASAPSNIVGPLRPDQRWLIDEQFDRAHWAPESNNLTLQLAYAHGRYLEDVGVARRADEKQPGRLVYRVPGTLRSFTVFAHGTEVPLRFTVMNHEGHRVEVAPQAEHFQSGRRTRYELTLSEPHARAFEIEITAGAPAEQAIGRVEITWIPTP